MRNALPLGVDEDQVRLAVTGEVTGRHDVLVAAHERVDQPAGAERCRGLAGARVEVQAAVVVDADHVRVAVTVEVTGGELLVLVPAAADVERGGEGVAGAVALVDVQVAPDVAGQQVALAVAGDVAAAEDRVGDAPPVAA